MLRELYYIIFVFDYLGCGIQLFRYFLLSIIYINTYYQL